MSLVKELKKVNPYYWAGLAAALVVFGADKIMNQPFGIKNNNPGNLRPSVDAWQGQTGIYTSPHSGQFLIFDTAENGIRAMARTLLNYWRKHGLNTVAGIVGRYAPSTENNTSSYAKAVASDLGLAPTDTFDVEAMLPDLVTAMMVQEIGAVPYAFSTIDDATTSALA